MPRAALVAGLLLAACRGGGGPGDAAAPSPGADGAVSASEGGGAAGARLLLTVNELPDYLNGSRPYTQRDAGTHEFRVRVNRADFTLDAIATGQVDFSTLAVSCDQPLTLPDATVVPPGQTLPAAAFTPTARAGSRRIHFEAPALPDDVTVTCRGEVRGPGGMAASALTFLAASLPPSLDPFLQPDRWLVILSRDLFRMVGEPQPDGTRLLRSEYLPDGNGEPDLDEALYELGLLSRKNAEVARVVRARLLAEVRRQAHRIFGLSADGRPAAEGARLELFFEGDPGAPAAAAFGDGTFSMIALGGDGMPEEQAARLFGQADVDWNNRRKNNDAVYGRGVYVNALVRQVLVNPASLVLLGPLLPGRGTPMGEEPGDARLVAPDFDPKSADTRTRNRYEVYGLMMRLLSTALGSLLCHEIGHSLGLVPSGPPPTGMFAEMPGLDFTVQDVPGPHIDTPGLNVEQTGATTNWMEALTEEPRFNELSLAYLRRRLVVGSRLLGP